MLFTYAIVDARVSVFAPLRPSFRSNHRRPKLFSTQAAGVFTRMRQLARRPFASDSGGHCCESTDLEPPRADGTRTVRWTTGQD
jgi:hypothetical protein